MIVGEVGGFGHFWKLVDAQITEQASTCQGCAFAKYKSTFSRRRKLFLKKVLEILFGGPKYALWKMSKTTYPPLLVSITAKFDISLYEVRLCVKCYSFGKSDVRAVVDL